jgi:ABC-2 type transport system permease protein
MFAASFFGINATPTAKISPELMQRSTNLELHKCILRAVEFALRPSSFVFSFILLGYFCSSFYAAIGAAVDNQTDSQQISLP